MKKHVISTAALLSAGLMASAAQAGTLDFAAVDAAPAANAAIKIEMAGSCAAKIVLPVTAVEYDLAYDEDAAATGVDVDTVLARLKFVVDGVGAGPDFEIETFNTAKNYGQKVADATVRNVRRSQVNFVGAGYVNSTEAAVNGKTTNGTVLGVLDALQSGDYDGQIRCRDGQTLASNVSAATLGKTANVEFDVNGEKVNASFSHVNTVAAPNDGTYVAKLTSYGTLDVPTQCAVRGTLATDNYVLACKPARVIKVKVTAYAKGASVL